MSIHQGQMTKMTDMAVSEEMFLETEGIESPLTDFSLMFSRKIGNHTYPFSKRLFDLVAMTIGLVLSSPLFIAIAAAIKIDSTGPVFHKQKRVGRSGQLFEMYKFRTMIPNAKDMLDDIKHLNEVEGKLFKMQDDPRVTRVGKFLRKFSIDELPQLFNVLKGDMSLVGNRPPLPEEVSEYEEWEFQRLMGIPGITGLWQVSGRSELPFKKMVELDIHYHKNRSLLMDILIMLKTIPAVFKGDGAY